jgi:hypothetical protein
MPTFSDHIPAASRHEIGFRSPSNLPVLERRWVPRTVGQLESLRGIHKVPQEAIMIIEACMRLGRKNGE